MDFLRYFVSLPSISADLVNIKDVIKDTIMVGDSNPTNANKWFKVLEQSCSENTNTNIMFAVTRTYATGTNYGTGILSLQLRRSSTDPVSVVQFKWLINNGCKPENFVITINEDTWGLYVCVPRQYDRCLFDTISGCDTQSIRYVRPIRYTPQNTTPEETVPVAAAVSQK